MLSNLRADLARYTKFIRTKKDYFYLIFEQGIWAIAVYRFGRWAHGFRVPLLGLVLRLLAFLLFKLMEVLTGISLPASVAIGKGLYVGHFGPVILHSDVVIGKNCSLGPGVVIGTRGQGAAGAPKLGDSVYVGVGAKVLGGIQVGNNVNIGANSVVLKDIPDGATAVGIPARVIMKNWGEAAAC